MALTSTDLDHPPRVPLARSDAVVVCDLVDLPAIGVGRLTGKVPDLPRFDLDYLISALEQARGLAGQFPEHTSVGVALSKRHPRDGARCLIIAVEGCDIPSAAEREEGAHPCDGCDWWTGRFCECPPARPCPQEESP